MPNKREMKRALKKMIPDMVFNKGEGIFDDDDEGGYYGYYIGSYMSLDPCGRYHHILSPNGVTKRCINYWDRLDEAAEEAGGWIQCGEGDPTDIFFCVDVETYNEVIRKKERKKERKGQKQCKKVMKK